MALKFYNGTVPKSMKEITQMLENKALDKTGDTISDAVSLTTVDNTDKIYDNDDYYAINQIYAEQIRKSIEYCINGQDDSNPPVTKSFDDLDLSYSTLVPST